MVEFRHQQTLRALKPDAGQFDSEHLNIGVLDLYHDLSLLLQELPSEFCIISGDNVLWPGHLAVSVAKHILEKQLLCLPYLSDPAVRFGKLRGYADSLTPPEVLARCIAEIADRGLFDEPAQNFLAEVLAGLQAEDLAEVIVEIFPAIREQSSSKVTMLLGLLAESRSLDIIVTGTVHSVIMKSITHYLPFFVSDAYGINTRINEEGRILPKTIEGNYRKGLLDRARVARYAELPLFAMAYELTDETEPLLEYSRLAIILNAESDRIKSFVAHHPLVVMWTG
jgi:predicted HTH domain antitoxin